MKTESMKGSCLCGAIEISAPAGSEVDVCHCSMCRRWGGGPLLTVHSKVPIELGGTATPATYRSSEWAERGFCPNCGTHLFYHLLQSDEYAIPAGIFQDADHLQMTTQIFVDEKPAYYEFANRTRNMTGEEVFAQYTKNQD